MKKIASAIKQVKCLQNTMLQQTLTIIHRAALTLAGITFHVRTASVFAVAALLLTMAPRADAQFTIFPGLFSSTVDFFQLHCFQTSGEGSSDEPYLFFVVGNLVTGDLVVKRTTIFGDVDSGEDRNQTVRLWGPSGVALSFPNGNPDNLVILVGAMEHDNSDVAKLLAKLQSSLPSRFLTLRGQLLSGSITRASLVTQLTTTFVIQEQSGGTGIFPNADDITCRPVELRITSADVSAGNVVKALDLDGRGTGDGLFRAFFRVQSNIQTFTTTGTFHLTPDEATVTAREQQRLVYQFTWTVPAGEVWTDLQTMDLRIGDEVNPLLWVRFTEADRSVGLVDAATGEIDRSGSASENGPLETSNVALYLEESLIEAGGPTSPSVTLTLSLRFKPSAAGHTYPVEVRAVDDNENEHGFEPAGILTVK